MSEPTLGPELRKLRRAADKSIACIADELGISIIDASRIERGLDRLSTKRIKQFAAFIGAPEKTPWLLSLAASWTPKPENLSEDGRAFIDKACAACGESFGYFGTEGMQSLCWECEINGKAAGG